MACCNPEKSSKISTGVLFVGLAFLAAFNYWWPGILLVLGIYRGLRFFLDCNHKNMWAHIVIFIGLYLIFTFQSSLTDVFAGNWVLPGIFIIIAICYFIRSCCKKNGCGTGGGGQGGGQGHHHGGGQGGGGGGCCGG